MKDEGSYVLLKAVWISHPPHVILGISFLSCHQQCSQAQTIYNAHPACVAAATNAAAAVSAAATGLFLLAPLLCQPVPLFKGSRRPTADSWAGGGRQKQ